MLTVAGIALSAAALGAISFASRGRIRGRLAFRLWRAISAEGHGGRFIAVNGIRIYYETYGSGPPVLVLHGGLGSIEDMGNQIRALSATHFVIAVDSRGHGRSSDSSSPLTYRVMADDMRELLDGLKLRKVDIVGWSDGGIIGLDIAMRWPQRVGHLVAIGANFDPDGLIQRPPAASAFSRPELRRDLGSPPTREDVLREKVITMWRTQPHFSAMDLGRIEAPTLVMVGEFDVVRPAHTQQLATAIPHAELVIVPGATHRLPSEKPGIVNALILRFLEERPP